MNRERAISDIRYVYATIGADQVGGYAEDMLDTIIYHMEMDPNEYRETLYYIETLDRDDYVQLAKDALGDTEGINDHYMHGDLADMNRYLDETLSFLGRKRIGRATKRRKNSLKIARNRQKKKVAPAERIFARAARRARANVAAHLLHGKRKSDLSAAAKARLEKQVKARSARVKAVQRKLLPTVRKDDRKK